VLGLRGVGSAALTPALACDFASCTVLGTLRTLEEEKDRMRCDGMADLLRASWVKVDLDRISCLSMLLPSARLVCPSKHARQVEAPVVRTPCFMSEAMVRFDGFKMLGCWIFSTRHLEKKHRPAM